MALDIVAASRDKYFYSEECGSDELDGAPSWTPGGRGSCPGGHALPLAEAQGPQHPVTRLPGAAWTWRTSAFAHLLVQARRMAEPEVNREASTLCPLDSKGRSQDTEWRRTVLLQEGQRWNSSPQ